MPYFSAGHKAAAYGEKPAKERRRRERIDPKDYVDGLLARIADSDAASQRLLEGVAAQIVTLRDELMRVQEALDRERRSTRHHSFLPLLNRFGFEERVERAIRRMDGMSMKPALILAHVVNADEIRREHGRHVLDRALGVAAEALNCSDRGTAALGLLGGNDVGALVVTDTPEEARQRLNWLIQRVNDVAVIDGIKLTAVGGFSMLELGMTVEQALEAADFDLVRNIARTENL